MRDSEGIKVLLADNSQTHNIFQVQRHAKSVVSGSENNLRGDLHLDETPFSKTKLCWRFFFIKQRESPCLCVVKQIREMAF